ncbi:VPLPA-CTERM sorting domain-containing protein [Seohaeicola zhoushanensis]|uniref:VPLPA-CTERM protein sorting domain-containing protein n=1 Tax=Seohaeicola zhoushanensis TaxID=1569283 RepID=A0A8J3M7M8_9RHOB|nr:VPLPA-CTERM sorting domain-containing protein [Seohaeicola zhoushanensis]GHF53433.1 hypothetical protein GCM10017056_26300 [Seohaeicola zhoushanensis]
MRRYTLLTTTALALCAAAPALAATCTPVGAGFTCTVLGSDPILSTANGATVTVQSGASVVSIDDKVTPVAMQGDNATVLNDGLIEQADTAGFAITGEGTGLKVVNAGQIKSGGRSIVMLSGSGLEVINQAGATIESRQQTIRAEENITNTRVENWGTISATDGRALQLRAEGSTVINHGLLTGGEEVVEARGGFHLENYGTIKLNDEANIVDEDGVQFAGGTVLNAGMIRGTDDGIDMDEGTVTNTATGRIISLAPDANDNSGIDIDEVYEDGVNPNRQNGTVKIVNAGLIEGPSAIGADDAATNSVEIENAGTLRGRGDLAIRLAPVQGDSKLTVLAGSEIFGGIRFGSGNDQVIVDALFGGAIADGVIDGGLGLNTALFAGFQLDDLLSFSLKDGLVSLAFLDDEREVSGLFRNFTYWELDGTRYSTEALASAATPVPLPAGLPLLLAGLGGLALLRRRA